MLAVLSAMIDAMLPHMLTLYVDVSRPVWYPHVQRHRRS